MGYHVHFSPYSLIAVSGTYAKGVKWAKYYQCAGQPGLSWSLPQHNLKQPTAASPHPWEPAICLHFREGLESSFSFLAPLVPYRSAVIIIGTPERACGLAKESRKEPTKHSVTLLHFLTHPPLLNVVIWQLLLSAFPFYPFRLTIQIVSVSRILPSTLFSEHVLLEQPRPFHFIVIYMLRNPRSWF